MDVNQAVVDKQFLCLAEFDRRLRAKLGAHIKEEDLAQHGRAPFGLHSDDLARVLHYARSQPISGKLAVVRLGSFDAYGIAALSGSRSEPAKLLPQPRFTSYAQACQYVLLRRIEAVRGAAARGEHI